MQRREPVKEAAVLKVINPAQNRVDLKRMRLSVDDYVDLGIMAVPLSMTLWVARMIWMALGGWVVSCLAVADEIAGSLRTGEIGPLHVG